MNRYFVIIIFLLLSSFTIAQKNESNTFDIVISKHMPFSLYALEYVESRINEWQKKGEFEKTLSYQQRVNEATRNEKIRLLTVEAETKYIEEQSKNIVLALTLCQYDPDNEVFLIKDNYFGDLLVPVPIEEAANFKDNWNLLKKTPSYFIEDDQLALSSINFVMNPDKTYQYSNDAFLNYTLAKIDYRFDEINIESPNNISKQGQQYIDEKSIVVGKSFVDSNIPQSETHNENTFVVIVANENYQAVTNVPYAQNDGEIFKRYCISTLGIPEKNVRFRVNATLNNMRTDLEWLKQVCIAYHGEISILFYYAGHGIPDEETKSSYLLPVDGDGSYVQSGYKLDDLFAFLGSVPAKSVVAFLDACFSGSKRDGGMLASARGVALKAKTGAPQGNMVVFSAAQGDETAYPNNDEGHGMFTYYLLKKLQETSGDITLYDLGTYITKNVSQQSILLNGKSQTPCVTASSALGTDWQNWKLK